MAGFDRFGKVWAANGLLDDPTDAESNQGWLYIGQAPPTVEQFNSTHRWWDEKDNWLYGQIATVIIDAQLTPVANDLTTLLQALNRRLAAYVLKAGDTMTGALFMSGGPNGVSWAAPGAIPYGAWNTSRMGFGWDGSKLRVKVDGTDVGSIALNYVPGDYVLRSGDTMTGTLINQQTVQANYLHSLGDIVADRNVVGNFIHSNGDMTAAGSLAGNWIHSYTDVIADAAVHSNYIHSYGNVRADNYLDGANLTVAGGTTLHYTHIVGNIDVDNTVTADYVHANTHVTAGVNVVAQGGIAAFGTGSGLGFNQSAQENMVGGIPSFYWGFERADATLVYSFSGQTYWCMRAWDGTAYVCFNQKGPVAGVGNYQNLSDERGKQNIRDSTIGLAEIKQLKPVLFDRLRPNIVERPDKKPQEVKPIHPEIGFIAQEVRDILPEAVSELGIELPNGEGGLDSDSPSLGLDIVPIVAALVNAVKELDERTARQE